MRTALGSSTFDNSLVRINGSGRRRSWYENDAAKCTSPSRNSSATGMARTNGAHSSSMIWMAHSGGTIHSRDKTKTPNCPPVSNSHVMAKQLDVNHRLSAGKDPNRKIDALVDKIERHLLRLPLTGNATVQTSRLHIGECPEVPEHTETFAVKRTGSLMWREARVIDSDVSENKNNTKNIGMRKNSSAPNFDRPRTDTDKDQLYIGELMHLSASSTEIRSVDGTNSNATTAQGKYFKENVGIRRHLIKRRSAVNHLSNNNCEDKNEKTSSTSSKDTTESDYRDPSSSAKFWRKENGGGIRMHLGVRKNFSVPLLSQLGNSDHDKTADVAEGIWAASDSAALRQLPSSRGSIVFIPDRRRSVAAERGSGAPKLWSTGLLKKHARQLQREPHLKLSDLESIDGLLRAVKEDSRSSRIAREEQVQLQRNSAVVSDMESKPTNMKRTLSWNRIKQKLKV